MWLQFSFFTAGFPLRRQGFSPRSGHVRFVVDIVTLGQVFSEYLGSPASSIPLTARYSSIILSSALLVSVRAASLNNQLDLNFSVYPLITRRINLETRNYPLVTIMSFIFDTRNFWVSGLYPPSGVWKNTTFRKLDLFPSSGKEGEEGTYSVGPLRKG
jgi:hypothetical protein